MYWYYVCEWRRYTERDWNKTMNVFAGSFADMILMATKQPEEWVIVFAKEISKDEFMLLDGNVG